MSRRAMRDRKPVNYNEVKDGADAPSWLKSAAADPPAQKKATSKPVVDKENDTVTPAPKQKPASSKKGKLKKANGDPAGKKGGKRKPQEDEPPPAGKPAEKRRKSSPKKQQETIRSAREKVVATESAGAAFEVHSDGEEQADATAGTPVTVEEPMEASQPPPAASPKPSTKPPAQARRPAAAPAPVAVPALGPSQSKAFLKLQEAHAKLQRKYAEVKEMKLAEAEKLAVEQAENIEQHGKAASELAKHWEAEATRMRAAIDEAGLLQLQQQMKDMMSENVRLKEMLLEQQAVNVRLQKQTLESTHGGAEGGEGEDEGAAAAARPGGGGGGQGGDGEGAGPGAEEEEEEEEGGEEAVGGAGSTPAAAAGGAGPSAAPPARTPATALKTPGRFLNSMADEALSLITGLEATRDGQCMSFTHQHTGLRFDIRPSTETPAPGEEPPPGGEVEYCPIDLGSAAARLPDYLQEDIVFGRDQMGIFLQRLLAALN